jgi:hypothetical protein
MENFDLTTSSDYRKNKRNVIIGAILFHILVTIVSLRFEGNSSIEQIILFVSMIGTGFCILLWCNLDSNERDEKLGAGFRFLLVLFGIFALIVYLFRSRGFKQGIIAFGYLLLVFIVYVILGAVVLTISRLIFNG